MADLTLVADVGALTSSDLIMVIRNGQPYVRTVGELASAFQTTLLAAGGTLIGRAAVGTGAVQQLVVGTGLGVGGDQVFATGADHLDLVLLNDIDMNAEIIVNSADRPARMPLAKLLYLLGLGTAGPSLNQYLNLVANSGIAALI